MSEQNNFAVEHKLDTTFDEARALHRVWRALNDGDCPFCRRYVPAYDVLRYTDGSISCPKCRVTISGETIDRIQRLFSPVMEKCVKVYLDWLTKTYGTAAGQLATVAFQKEVSSMTFEQLLSLPILRPQDVPEEGRMYRYYIDNKFGILRVYRGVRMTKMLLD